MRTMNLMISWVIQSRSYMLIQQLSHGQWGKDLELRFNITVNGQSSYKRHVGLIGRSMLGCTWIYEFPTKLVCFQYKDNT